MAYENKYLDGAGLATLWAKIKEQFTNKNAFANVKVGDVTVAADSVEDTLELVAGSNITITPDATNDKITIAATNTTYGAEKGISLTSGKFGHSNTALTDLPTAAGLYKVKYDTYGHIISASAVTKADITGLGIPGTDTNTTYTFTGGTNKFTVTPSNGTAQDITVTPSITNNALTTSTVSGTVTGSSTGTAGVGGTVGAPSVTIAKGTVTDALGYTPVNESKTAAASGTDLSLVTTGEKATWNAKQDAITSSNKLSSSLVDGLGAAAAKGVDESLTLSSTSINLPTSAAVAGLVSSSIAAADAMIYKGTLGTGGTVTALPSTTAKVGWTYKVITAGEYTGAGKCEEGDMVICLTAGSSSKAATWTVVQANIDGAVTGPTSATDGHYAVFDGATGKLIKDGGAIFTHPTGKTKSSGLYKITVDDNGHVTAATAVAKADITSLGIPGEDTDTKVTAVGNHYTPTGGTAQSVPSSATALTPGTSTVITSVTIDAAGHVTSVGGGKLPDQSYTLPTASSSTKGGVKVGDGLSISSEVLSVNTLTTDEINAILV